MLENLSTRLLAIHLQLRVLLYSAAALEARVLMALDLLSYASSEDLQPTQRTILMAHDEDDRLQANGY